MLGVATIGLLLVLALAVGLVGVGVAIHIQVTAAADAAALAAAPVTFRPFGASGTPRSEAAAYARRNGATLVRCRCSVDRTWRRRTVIVEVARQLAIPGTGRVAFRAESRATFDPALLVGIPGAPTGASG